MGFLDALTGKNDVKSDEIYHELMDYYSNKLYDQGLEEALSACKRFPDEGRFFYMAGMFYYLKEKAAIGDLISSDKCLTTIKYYKKANKLCGDYSYSNQIAGIYKDDLHDYENAIKYYEEAILDNSKYEYTYQCISECHRELGNIDEAYAYYIKYLDTSNFYTDEDKKFVSLLGEVITLCYDGKNETAIKWLKQMLTNKKYLLSKSKIFIEISSIFYKMSQFEDSMENILEAEKYLKLGDEYCTNQTISYQKIKTLYSLGQYDECLTELNSYIKSSDGELDDILQKINDELKDKEFLQTDLQKNDAKEDFGQKSKTATLSDEITIKRGYTHRGRFIRFKTKVENNTPHPFRDVKVVLSLPSTLRCESPKTPESTIGDIESGETLACEFLLKPKACTTANVKGYVVYKDISGEIQTLTMRGKEIETCRPNLEHLPLTFADVTETISSKQLYKDSELIRLDGIGPADARPLLLKTAQWMNMHHVEDNGHEDQLIFVGRQKVEQTMVIARAAVQGDGVKVRCYVEREDLVAGFLAEFTENLEELLASSVKPSKDMIFRLQDHFDNIDDALSFDPSKDTIFTHLNKAYEICKVVDKAVSKEIAEFVDQIQMVKEHKDSLDDADIVRLKQSIDSWNEGLREKFQ